MAVVGVVGAVGDAPAVVGDQDGGVGDVAHQVVQLAVVAEALVAAAAGAEKNCEGSGQGHWLWVMAAAKQL